MKPGQIDGPLLQMLGTEWGRNTRDADIWVRAFKSSAMSYWEATPGGIIIVDDVRFPNELGIFDYDENVRKLTVRLNADKATRKGRADKWRENDEHLSEIALDSSDFDLVFDSSSESIGGICESIRSKFIGGL
jgi:hypothetical protein